MVNRKFEQDGQFEMLGLVVSHGCRQNGFVLALSIDSKDWFFKHVTRQTTLPHDQYGTT